MSFGECWQEVLGVNRHKKTTTAWLSGWLFFMQRFGGMPTSDTQTTLMPPRFSDGEVTPQPLGFSPIQNLTLGIIGLQRGVISDV